VKSIPCIKRLKFSVVWLDILPWFELCYQIQSCKRQPSFLDFPPKCPFLLVAFRVGVKGFESHQLVCPFLLPIWSDVWPSRWLAVSAISLLLHSSCSSVYSQYDVRLWHILVVCLVILILFYCSYNCAYVIGQIVCTMQPYELVKVVWRGFIHYGMSHAQTARCFGEYMGTVYPLLQH